MTVRPLVSIIVPAYNVRGYIGRTLASIKSQSMSEFETIIVNDGSTDGTEEVVKGFLDDPRFKLVTKPNGGVSSARNQGLDRSNGRYVVYIDGDDYVLPDYLEKLVSCIERSRTDLCFCESDYEKDGCMLKRYRYREAPSGDVLEDFLERRIQLGIECIIFRKDFLDEHRIRFKEGLTCFEDSLFTIQALCNGTTSEVKESLLRVVLREGSASQTFNLEKISQTKAVFEEALSIINREVQDRRLRSAYEDAIIKYALPLTLAELLNNASKTGHSYDARRFIREKKLDQTLIAFRPRSLPDLINYSRLLLACYIPIIPRLSDRILEMGQRLEFSDKG
jgi:glycosyltransferase involved in cell wall biosynthesis